MFKNKFWNVLSPVTYTSIINNLMLRTKKLSKSNLFRSNTLRFEILLAIIWKFLKFPSFFACYLANNLSLSLSGDMPLTTQWRFRVFTGKSGWPDLRVHFLTLTQYLTRLENFQHGLQRLLLGLQIRITLMLQSRVPTSVGRQNTHNHTTIHRTGLVVVPKTKWTPRSEGQTRMRAEIPPLADDIRAAGVRASTWERRDGRVTAAWKSVRGSSRR